jgi:hypothetical protein
MTNVGIRLRRILFNINYVPQAHNHLTFDIGHWSFRGGKDDE